MHDSFSRQILHFLKSVSEPEKIGNDVSFMNPYRDPNVMELCELFFTKYFNDKSKRVIIFGINPGRFGGGITGSSFTDPVALESNCGITNHLNKRKEISSEFIYEMIDKFGGARKFYSKVFLTAVYPLALIRNGKNFNYYDDKKVTDKMFPHLRDSFEKQFYLNSFYKTAISLGKKNYGYLKRLNDEFKFFNDLKILEHPRFIMQYRRKHKDEYIAKYLTTIQGILNQ